MRDVYPSAGAGFVVALAGDIMTMPGLAKTPSAETIRVHPGRPHRGTLLEETMTQPSIVSTDNAPKAIGPYSQALVIGELVFTAGQIALDPASMEVIEGGIREQTVQVLANLQAVLPRPGQVSPRLSRPPSSWPTWPTSRR